MTRRELSVFCICSGRLLIPANFQVWPGWRESRELAAAMRCGIKSLEHINAFGHKGERVIRRFLSQKRLTKLLMRITLPCVRADVIFMKISLPKLESPSVTQEMFATYTPLASALATSLKFVIRHFAPLPTSEARFCKAAAARGLRRA